MKRICEFCGKEYDWEEGQPNRGKNGPKNGKGTIKSEKFCSFNCGIKFSSNLQKQTRLLKLQQDPNYYIKISKKMANTKALKYKENPNYYINANKKSKQTRLLKYGNENYNNIEKTKQTNLKKYGFLISSQAPCVKEKQANTCFNKYHTKSYLQTQEYKNLYKNKDWLNNLKNKEYNTKKKNGTFNTSKIESIIYQKLLNKFSNTQYQYRSDLYPFDCDFYIPDLDLYIEIQGTWLHGNKPYDPKDQECINLIKKWNNKHKEINFKGNNKDYYKSALYVYTQLDPLKRQTAKENNLNWIEFFNIEEFMEWYNEQ